MQFRFVCFLKQKIGLFFEKNESFMEQKQNFEKILEIGKRGKEGKRVGREIGGKRIGFFFFILIHFFFLVL